jgi:hypothetical protein
MLLLLRPGQLSCWQLWSCAARCQLLLPLLRPLSLPLLQQLRRQPLGPQQLSLWLLSLLLSLLLLRLLPSLLLTPACCC